MRRNRRDFLRQADLLPSKRQLCSAPALASSTMTATGNLIFYWQTTAERADSVFITISETENTKTPQSQRDSIPRFTRPGAQQEITTTMAPAISRSLLTAESF